MPKPYVTKNGEVKRYYYYKKSENPGQPGRPRKVLSEEEQRRLQEQIVLKQIKNSIKNANNIEDIRNIVVQVGSGSVSFCNQQSPVTTSVDINDHEDNSLE